MTRTLDEVLAMAGDAIDQLQADSVADFERTLRNLGATDEEISAELTRQLRDIAEWRASELAKLAAWLRRGGETAH